MTTNSVQYESAEEEAEVDKVQITPVISQPHDREISKDFGEPVTTEDNKEQQAQIAERKKKATKFTLNFESFKVDPINWDGEDALTADKKPIFQVLRTLYQLAKILIQRQKIQECLKILEFVKEKHAVLVGSADSLFGAKCCMDLALLFSQGTNAKGIAKYDEKDRPLKYAFTAEEIVGKVIKEENNYWKCKAALLLSKVYL